MAAVKAGTEGTVVADTSSTDAGGIYGWLFEVGGAGDFERARDAFKKAQAIVDRLAGVGAELPNFPQKNARNGSEDRGA